MCGEGVIAASASAHLSASFTRKLPALRFVERIEPSALQLVPPQWIGLWLAFPMPSWREKAQLWPFLASAPRADSRTCRFFCRAPAPRPGAFAGGLITSAIRKYNCQFYDFKSRRESAERPPGRQTCRRQTSRPCRKPRLRPIRLRRARRSACARPRRP